MELIKTDCTLSGVSKMTWSELEYSPASAAGGKRRHKSSQTAVVAIFPGCICICPVSQDVARPQRCAIFPVRAAAAAANGRSEPPTHQTSHNFLSLSFPPRPAGCMGPPPVELLAASRKHRSCQSYTPSKKHAPFSSTRSQYVMKWCQRFEWHGHNFAPARLSYRK